MRVPTSELREQDIQDIRRVLIPRGRQTRHEVVVVFSDMETRDRIASYARNLGDFVGPNNKPTAGIRPDVPSFLGGVHRALMQYGFDMRNKYREGFKRNVRFEDADHTFVIDMMIPGRENPNNEWTTVGYDRVLADRRSRAHSRDQGLGSRLCSTNMDQNLPSTGGQTVNSAGQANSGVGMGVDGGLPSTGVPQNSAGYAGSGAGMGPNPQSGTWGTHRG